MSSPTLASASASWTASRVGALFLGGCGGVDEGGFPGERAFVIGVVR